MTRKIGLFAYLALFTQTRETRISTWRRMALWSVAAVAALTLGSASAGAQAAFPSETVGTASGGQAVQVTANTAGTVSSIEVLTTGQASLDFTADTLASDSGLTTCTGANLAVNGSCNVGVIFTPTAPGMRIGAVALLNAANTVLGTAYIYGTGLGPVAAFVPGYVTRYAGNGENLGARGDGDPATEAELYLPSGVAFDGAGNLYIGDTDHNRVRMVCSGTSSGIINGTPAKCTAAGIIITVAGGGNGCAAETDTFGDGCPASDSTLSSPGGVTVDGAGNLFIADSGNDLIREVSAVSGVITVFAGNLDGAKGVCAGATDSLGDGCPATSATLNEPQGVTLDVFGNAYIADTSDARIRMVAPSGVITTVAGGGTGCGAQTDSVGDGCSASQAILENPYPVAFDASGNMYIPDSSHNRVREVAATGGAVTSSSGISDFAGTGTAYYSGDGGAAKSATLFAPSGVAIDPAQNVYIADTQNSAIRKVSADTLDIETIISPANNQTYGADEFKSLSFYEPIGIAFDGQGDLFIGDSLEMVVQEMQSNLTLVNLLPPPYTNPVRVGALSNPQLITIENIGNAPLDLTAINPATNAQVDAGTTTCNTTTPLGVGDPCIVGAVFAPTTASVPLITNIDVTGQTPNTPLDIEIVGYAEAVNSTTTTITSSLNPSDFGQRVTFTVGITSGTASLNGTVTITDTFNGAQTTLVSGLAVVSSGTSATATYSTSTLPVGQHSIVAAYGNDTNGHSSSTSIDNGASPLPQIVNEVTTTTLTSSGSPSTLGASVTFTATVAISGGGGVTPDGTVTFMNGTTVLGTPQALPANGIVTYATAALPLGNNPITAVYSGDATIEVLGSTSAVVTQEVQTTSISAVTSTPNPSDFGQQVTFTATVSPGTTTTVAPTGTVTFLDNGASIGTGTLSGNPATATFQTSSLAVGTHPITVSYAGDANFSGSTSTVVDSQVVNGSQTTTTVTATPNPGISGVPVAITATISSMANATLVTGTVTFTVGTTTVGPLNVTNGVVTTKQTLAAGTYQVVATYSGNSNLGGSTSSSYTLTINNATAATTLNITPNPAVADGTINFSATVTSNGVAPTGTVSFMSGSTTLGTAPVTNGLAVFTTTTLAVGNYAVTAVYSGDANNGTSTSATVNLTVGLIPTTTDLVATSTAGTPPQILLVSVVTGTQGPTPTGTVTFSANGQTLGSATLDSSGVGTITPNLPNGTFQVTAAYSGDTVHAPSQSTAVSVSGAPSGFSLTVTPSTLSMAASQNATVAVNVTSVGTFADTVALGCSALPAGVTCTFANPSVTLAAGATASSQLVIDTNSPLGGGTSAMNSSKGRSLSLAGLFLPFSVMFGFVLWRLRRRTASLFTMALVAALSLGALMATGCNGFGASAVTPGTYTVVITGTGTQSDTVHYTTLALTITK